MARIPLKIPKGFYANGTEYEQKNRWVSGNKVRWIDNSLRPIGGNRRAHNLFAALRPVRSIHSWQDLNGNRWVAWGWYDGINATKAAFNPIFDIAAGDLASGRKDADYEDGYGYGFYGNGTYGVPINQVQDGIYDPATTWSLDNFGEILIGTSDYDGKIRSWNLQTKDETTNLIQNGDFSSSSGWQIQAQGGSTGGWTINTSSGYAEYERPNFGNHFLYQTISTTVGTKYLFDADNLQVTQPYNGQVGLGPLNVTVREGSGLFGDYVDDVDGNPILDDIFATNNFIEFVATTTSVTLILRGTTLSTNYTTRIDNVYLAPAPTLATIPNAPVNNIGSVVTDERFIFALGAGGNPRKVQWCDREDKDTWTPTATNEAGDIELSDVGEIMCGVKTRGQTLVLTTTAAHSFRYIGPPYVYSTNLVGQSCGVISRQAAVNTEAGVYWMGEEGFYYFDGNIVRDLPCEVLDHVFRDFKRSQKSKIFSWVNSHYNEVWWHYPSNDALQSEPDRYVSYNYKENYWMMGSYANETMPARTCALDRGVFNYPLMVDYNYQSSGDIHYGYMLETEVGTSNGTTAEATTGPIEIGNGDEVMRVSKIYPDTSDLGDVSLRFYHRDENGKTWNSQQLQNTNDADGQIDVRFTGRQIKMQVQGSKNTDWRSGTVRIEATKGGKR